MDVVQCKLYLLNRDMINLVTIDPSINSTGLTINGEVFSIASANIALTKSLKLNKWFELCEDHATIHTVDTSYGGIKNYAELEIIKLDTYQKIANLVRTLVDKHVNPLYNTLVLIEGYSYSSASGPLIDLVTLSTLIRRNLFSRKDTDLVVIAPQALKKLAGWLTYPMIAKGKKVEYRNNLGVASGSFNKHDIYTALIENVKIKTDWVEFLRAQHEEIKTAKSVPKPIEDINDAVTLFHIAEKALEVNNADYKDTLSFLRSS